MKKNYFFQTAFSFFLMLFFCNTLLAQDQTVTKSFSEFGFANAETFPQAEINDYLSFFTEKGNATTDPAYYTSGTNLRLYAGGGNGGSITFEATGITIKSIVLNATNTYAADAKYYVDGSATSTPISSSNNVYTINNLSATESVKFQNAASGQIRLTSFTIVYEINSTDPESEPVVTSETFTAQVGVEASFQVQATENPSSYAFTGTLPDGLSFSTTNGKITGTPAEAGSFSINVTATNSAGTSAPAAITINVDKGMQTASFGNINTHLGAEDITLPATTEQGFNLVYSVDNTAVVTITGNVLSAVGVGTTTVTVSNEGDANYDPFSATFTVTVTEEPEFYTGQGTFSLVTSGTQLTDGYYVIANQDSQFIMSSGRSGSADSGYYLKEDIVLTDGKIVNPATTVVWKIESFGDGYTIYNEEIEKYVGWISGNSASAEDTPAERTTWTFNYNVAESKFYVNNVADPARQLSYNSSSPRFAAYGNSNQHELQLYKLGLASADEAIWENGEWSQVPSAELNVIIKSPLVVDGVNQEDFEAKDLTVTTSGSLTITEGNTVTVAGKITNQGVAANFVVESGANLMQTQDETNEGNITVKRVSNPIKRLDYTMWSSPVVGQNIQAFSPNTLAERIYTYEGANGYVVTDVNADFQSGKGYLFRAPNNWNETTPTAFEGNFVGVPFGQAVVVPTVENHYTSVGNPYPSNIDADLFLLENPNVFSMYFWTNYNPFDGSEYTGNNYATYTFMGGTGTSGPENNEALVPNGVISVGQGFIVFNAANSVSFNNDMRINASSLFFKNENIERHRIWLNLNSQDNKAFNQILVGYMTDATNGVDNQIDAKMFGYEGNALYSLLNNEEYVIQGKALPFETTDVIPLGFRAVDSGDFKISLANVDGIFADEDVKVYLKDRTLDVVHDLATPYEFSAEAGVYNERFEVVFEGDDLAVADLNNASVVIYTNENEVVVKAADKLQSVEIYDLQGRLMSAKQALNTNTYSYVAKQNKSQILVVKATTAKGEVVTKKVIVK